MDINEATAKAIQANRAILQTNKDERQHRKDWWLGRTPEQLETKRKMAEAKVAKSERKAGIVHSGDDEFGPFRLDGNLLHVDGKTFDLHDSIIEFATDGKQKRFTGTRVVAGVAAGTLVFPPLALFALKRKDRKANAITVVDAAGQSFQFTFTQKNVLAAQAFLLKVEVIVRAHRLGLSWRGEMAFRVAPSESRCESKESDDTIR